MAGINREGESLAVDNGRGRGVDGGGGGEGGQLYRKWIKMLTSQRAAPTDRAESKVDTSAWTVRRIKGPLTSLWVPVTMRDIASSWILKLSDFRKNIFLSFSSD